jgi:hypothetical protein
MMVEQPNKKRKTDEVETNTTMTEQPDKRRQTDQAVDEVETNGSNLDLNRNFRA